MQALRSPAKPSTATFPRDPWTAEVQADFAKLRAEVGRLTQRHREALEALEDVCDQRDEARLAAQGARADADYWMRLARSEAERADQAQPLGKWESRWWSLAGMLGLIGAGFVLGLQVTGP